MSSETIFAVYKYITSTSVELSDSSSSYYLIRTFDENGPIDLSILEDAYAQVVEDSDCLAVPNQFGPFQNLTILNKFSYVLCEQLNASKICLLSVADYNNAVAEVSNITELPEKMNDIGNVILNIDKEDNDSGVLKKWFVGTN